MINCKCATEVWRDKMQLCDTDWYFAQLFLSSTNNMIYAMFETAALNQCEKNKVRRWRKHSVRTFISEDWIKSISENWIKSIFEDWIKSIFEDRIKSIFEDWIKSYFVFSQNIFHLNSNWFKITRKNPFLIGMF